MHQYFFPCENQYCRAPQGETWVVQDSRAIFSFSKVFLFLQRHIYGVKKYISWSSHCRFFLHGDNAIQKKNFFSIF